MTIAHDAHPSPEDHDPHLDQHDDVVPDERPCACNDGWVTIGQVVVDPDTGEETEEFAQYLCRQCAERS
jgi:hypothetical protein